MKKYLLILNIITTGLINSQTVNVGDFGAKGNGVINDTSAFLTAIKYANDNFTAKKISSTIFVPAGTYILSSSLIFSKYISIQGEFVNTTILRMDSPNKELIILEENRDESIIYKSYNYVKNLTLQGPTFAESPFTEKKTLNKIKSVGVKVMGLRTRIEDLQIEGFSNAGIEIKAAYYTYIKNCFIKNNGIGIVLNDMTTSAFIGNNELRFNSIGIHIKDNSYANFINNNMIESNIALYIPYDFTDNYEKTFSTGKGILIENSQANTITNNYFENQFVNIAIVNSDKNILNSNFIAIGDTNVNRNKNQISLQLIGTSKYNIFENNSFLTTKTDLKANKIVISNDDLSTNVINVGQDNEQLKSTLNSQFKNEKKLPKIIN